MLFTEVDRGTKIKKWRQKELSLTLLKPKIYYKRCSYRRALLYILLILSSPRLFLRLRRGPFMVATQFPYSRIGIALWTFEDKKHKNAG